MIRFLRFCVVGGVGFIVDAGILELLTHAADVGPITARAFSFSTAVLITWLMNRSWAFRDRLRLKAAREFMVYFSVQGVGLAVNFGTYALLVKYAISPFNYPIVALCIATSISMIINYSSLITVAFPGNSKGE